MKAILIVLGAFFVVATLLPLIRHEAWWIRIFDFPRAQIALGGVLVTGLYVTFLETENLFEDLLLAALLFCVAFQAVKMFPYTFLASTHVKAAGGEEASRSEQRLSLLIANVLMENREAAAFAELAREYDPDVILTVETDQWWVDRLSDLGYPHTIAKPLPNTYGMFLQSKLELIDPVVEYVIEDSVPSIHALIRLRSGVRVQLHCLHPKPPYPLEDTTTIERDAELLVIGRRVRERPGPTVVMGDLNDVAWSYTTTLFQRISGLMDPRIGRGRFSTFHAQIPVLRWPLDHIFHTHDFKLVSLERLPAWGSDHFPIFVELHYSPDAVDEHDAPDANPEDEQEADGKIQKAYESQ